jgi:hypothetical protein
MVRWFHDGLTGQFGVHGSPTLATDTIGSNRPGLNRSLTLL